MLISSILCATLQLLSQDSIPDFDFVSESNPWILSENAAGLNEFNGEKISIATLRADKNNGDFINYYESDNSHNIDVLTETYYRLNPKFTIYGKVNYSYFAGQNMSGSAFIDPYYNAFDIVELSDSTAGKKNKESYVIVGGVSSNLTENLSLGALIDYKNISYFKVKDLRHTNDLLDLKLNIGLKYKLKNLDIGASYKHHRSVESIIFDSFGNTDRQYYTFIDFGGFMGKIKPYDNVANGMSSGGDENPYFNEENGLNLQLNLFSKQKLSFFNELSLSKGDGYYGVESTSTAIYTEHSSDSYSYKGIFSLEQKNTLHQLSLKASYYEIENILNDPQYIDDEWKGNIVTYGIAKPISSKDKAKIALNYAGYWGIENGKALWCLKAQGAYTSSTQRSIFYEQLTYRDQEINQIQTSISGYRNFYKERNSYRIFAGIGYGTGSGFAFEDLYLLCENHDKVESLNDLTYHEFDYFTADRVNAEISFRYSRLINANKAKIYSKLDYSATKAFNTSYIGDYYGSASFTLGYQF